MNGRAFKMHFGKNTMKQKERRRQARTETLAQQKGQTAETTRNRRSCNLT